MNQENQPKIRFRHFRDEEGRISGTVCWEPVPETDFVVVGVSRVHPKDRVCASRKVGRRVALARMAANRCPIVHKDFFYTQFQVEAALLLSSRRAADLEARHFFTTLCMMAGV